MELSQTTVIHCLHRTKTRAVSGKQQYFCGEDSEDVPNKKENAKSINVKVEYFAYPRRQHRVRQCVLNIENNRLRSLIYFQGLADNARMQFHKMADGAMCKLRKQHFFNLEETHA